MPTAVQRILDPTAGMELVTGDEVAIEANRFLFLGVDLLDPARREELDLPPGEELPNVCLRRTAGMVPQCEITPLEMWGEPLPLSHFPEGQRPFRIKDTNPLAEAPNTVGARLLVGQPLFFIPMYPGELIVDATDMASGDKRGIAEITVLRGYTDIEEVKRIEHLFFNDEHPRNRLLRLNRERIEQVATRVADPDVRAIADDMFKSLAQSERYMTAKVDKCHAQLDQRVAHQHTFTYSPKIRSFMEQLEIRPRNQGAAQLQDDVLKAVASSGLSPEMLDAIMSRQGAVMAAAMAAAIKEVMGQPPAAPTEPPTPAAPEAPKAPKSK